MSMVVPPPHLQIVDINRIYPHEYHDSQRSMPLLARLRTAETLTNPPIVAAMNANDYVILDGANRFHCFQELSIPHLLVQIVDYNTELVDLSVWQHIVSNWQQVYFIEQLQNIEGLSIEQGWQHGALAEITLRDGIILSLMPTTEHKANLNQLLREIVQTYQQQAALYRTALTDPQEIWPLYPQAIALVKFPKMHPADIMQATQHGAYLPPGISRHIIHGRALKLNYPMDALNDPHRSIELKNSDLQKWVQQKFAARSVRYYAESTFQFDE